MSLIRISTILLVFISTQVICTAPEYCEKLITNGSFSAFEIFRLYQLNQTEHIRVYKENVEIELELTSDMSLNFKYRIKREDPAAHKYGAYVDYLEGEDRWFTRCRNISSDGVIQYDLDVSRPLFVIPYKHSEHVLILDQNDRNRHLAVYPPELLSKEEARTFLYMFGVKVSCDGSNINTTLCRKPTFLQQLNDSYFNVLEGVLDVTVGNKFAYLLLFYIEGHNKYCFTFEENLSQECDSSANMKTLFAECFHLNDGWTAWTDPWVWGFVILVIITIFLIIAIVWTAYKRKKRQTYRFQLDATTKSVVSEATLTSVELKRFKNIPKD